MKQIKATSVVFCALLLSTFGHELLNRQKTPPFRLLSHVKNRKQDSKEECHLECLADSGNSTLQIFVNTTTNLVAVASTKTEVALILDINSGLVGLFNALSHSVIVINIERSTGIAFSQNSTWDKSETFQQYFQTVTSLKVIFEQGKHQGDKFSANNITQEIAIQITFVLKILTSDKYSIQVKEALDVLVDVSKNLLKSLEGLTEIIKSQAINTDLEIKELIGIINGLASFVKHLNGGISVLTKHLIKLDLDIIVNSKTAIDVFLYILLQLKPSKLDLKEVLRDRFDTPESFFSLIAKLGGNSTRGINGILTILSKIIILTQRTSIESVVVALIQFFGSLNGHNFAQEWQTAIENLSRTVNQLKLNETLKVVVKLLEEIREEKWIENQVNLSTIVKILTSASTPIDSIIKILVVFQKLIPTNVSLPFLIIEFVRLLTTKTGLITIVALIPQIKNNLDTKKSRVEFLQSILRAIDIKNSNKIGKALKHIPIVKTIYSELKKSLKEAHLELDNIIGEKASRHVLLEIRKILIKAIRDESGGKFSSGGHNDHGNDNSNKHLAKNTHHKIGHSGGKGHKHKNHSKGHGKDKRKEKSQ